MQPKSKLLGQILSQEDSRCRMCGKVDETINHLSSANATKWRRKNTRIDMIGLGEESTGTYAGSLGYM